MHDRGRGGTGRPGDPTDFSHLKLDDAGAVAGRASGPGGVVAAAGEVLVDVVDLGDRAVRATAVPISIDTEGLRAVLDTDEVQAQLKQQLEGALADDIAPEAIIDAIFAAVPTP